MEKKNFKAFTKLNPLKKNAIQLCGQEFVDSLTANGIYAKDDEFWIEVNRKLNIPDNAYEQKKNREKVEEELIERSSTGDSLILLTKGMQVARDMLKTINIDGVERLLEQRNYHEDYINYKIQ